MNCPSRVDEPEGTGWNQNPNALAADLTTREDLNGLVNGRELKRSLSEEVREIVRDTLVEGVDDEKEKKGGVGVESGKEKGSEVRGTFEKLQDAGYGDDRGRGRNAVTIMYARNVWKIFRTLGKFVGPGFMVRSPT